MTPPRRVLRYEVPIDDQAHTIAAGLVLFAHPKRGETSPVTRLEVWVEAEVLSQGHERMGDPGFLNALTPVETAEVQVLGTGRPVPGNATWCASAIDGPLVWHLYRRP